MGVILSSIGTGFMWMIGLLFFINFSMAMPQYGTFKQNWKSYLFFWWGLVVLFIVIPGFFIYLAM